MMAGDSATWALVTVRAWEARRLAEEDSNAWVGITIFASMLPFFLVPPFAGLLADRMVRRNLVAWALAVNLAQGVALAVLALSGDIQMWQLVLFSFVNGSARAVQMTATQSLVANLVPRENLLNGYALTTATLQGSRLLGPGVIAPMMAVIEPGWIFLFCSTYYVASLYLVLRIHTKSTGVVEPARGVLYNLLAGLRYTYTHRTLSVIVVLVLFHCGLTMSYESPAA